MNDPKSLNQISCADDYDPNSMPVPKAREVIGRFLSPVTTAERVHIRAALGRVLAEDVISPFDVPAHDNSAMDGYAVRTADAAAGPSPRSAPICAAVHSNSGVVTTIPLVDAEPKPFPTEPPKQRKPETAAVAP